jgi:hypothetical protein
LGERFQALLVSAVDRLAALASDKVEELASTLGDTVRQGLAGKLSDMTANAGGVGMSALAAGAAAKMQGQNPLTAALKAGFGAMSTKQKVLLALVLILTAVLAPVILLLAAIGLLIAALVGAVSS